MDNERPEAELNERGTIKENLKDYDGAIDDFTKSIAVKPDYTSYMNRGTVKLKQGNYEAAIADYTSGISIVPHAQPGYSYYNEVLASCYENRGEAEQLKKDYKALSLILIGL